VTPDPISTAESAASTEDPDYDQSVFSILNPNLTINQLIYHELFLVIIMPLPQVFMKPCHSN